MNRFGLDNDLLYEKIRDSIRNSPIFKFDWFFLSRTPIELSRRGTTLMTCVMKEIDPPEEGTPNPGPNSGRKRKASSRNLTPTQLEGGENGKKKTRVDKSSSRDTSVA